MARSRDHRRAKSGTAVGAAQPIALSRLLVSLTIQGWRELPRGCGAARDLHYGFLFALGVRFRKRWMAEN